ncbi:HD domain-containing phosphohydrolase [Aliarcobacter lanthieri]|uniref:HD domain-containing phosphohydrolase n=1 Tax=Aliarcobacter lanthieri TaxID=1355374 RepID=UPI00047C3F7C|nr:HD domain-containing phosphohydrolase [Aliarcobacter lanthieri]QKF59519.1 multi-sensor domain-containing response regulator c-di-GMP phosphodiesterase, RpfG family [Aliarcobacter lanthieri]
MKKFLYFSIIFIGLLCSSYFFYYLPNTYDITNDIYLEKSRMMRELFLDEVKKKQEKTKIFAYLISQDSKIINALKNNDKINYDNVMNFLHKNGDYKNLWLHLISKDGYSRYRSWSDKKDDSLLEFRDDLRELFKDPKPSQAVSSGLFDLTFRSIQPIYDGDEFLGFIELISKFNSVASALKEKKIEPLFLLTEERSKILKEPFTQMFLGKNYIANLNASKDIINLLENTDISNFVNIGNYTTFDKYLVSNLEIKSVDGNNLALFLMFFDKKNLDLLELSKFRNQYLNTIVVFMIIYTLTFLYFVKTSYAKKLREEVIAKTDKINSQQKKLKSLLTIYDKNVIFSKTDLKGVITHASSAFCKISGYSKSELIGKPHNIVRHPDMPKELFQNMWENLKNKNNVTAEIKNLRKDGSYYWVIADLEPEYDENGKHIGYFAVREDITANKEIEEIQREIIFTLGSIAEFRSKETGEHVKRVAKYSSVLAKAYGLSKEDTMMLEMASPMHDIGKIAIPDSILNKPGKLTFDEFEIMKTHTLKGYEMLHVSERPLFKTAAQIALTHHEKYDGTGYPNNLKGEDIPIFGRITALADVFDAIGSDRCYKKAWELDKVLEHLKEQKGKHFDPKLVDIFFQNLDRILEIKNKYQDT